MRYRYLIPAFVAALAAGPVFAAPAFAADAQMAVLLKTLSNPFWGAMAQGIADGAKAAGVQYFQQAAESDQAAEAQLNICTTMMEHKPSAMIASAINSTNLLPCLKSATDAHIPVV